MALERLRRENLGTTMVDLNSLKVSRLFIITLWMVEGLLELLGRKPLYHYVASYSFFSLLHRNVAQYYNSKNQSDRKASSLGHSRARRQITTHLILQLLLQFQSSLPVGLALTLPTMGQSLGVVHL